MPVSYHLRVCRIYPVSPRAHYIDQDVLRLALILLPWPSECLCHHNHLLCGNFKVRNYTMVFEYITVTLICISLMISDVQPLLCALDICMLSSENCIFKSFAVYALLGIKPSTSCVLDKCSFSWPYISVLFAHYKIICFSLTKLVYYIF